MKEVYSNKIKESLKLGNRRLIITIILVLMTIGFIVWAVIDSQKEYPTPKYLNDVIMEGKNEEGVYSCVNVTAIPYVFAETSTNEMENKYYFIRDDNYFYIAYLDYKTFSSLNHESIEDNPVAICGMTSSIESNIKRLAIEVYNRDMESEVVNDSNFNNYFGGVYLDVVADVNDITVQICLAIITGVFAIIIGAITIVFKTKTKKFIKNVTAEEWQQINNEIESSDTKYYKQAKIYLTKNYLIDFSNCLYAVKYSDIVWLYPYELRQNGITTAKNLIVFDKSFTKHTIAGIGSLGKKNKQIFEEITNEILSKNKDIIWGFSSESKGKFKELKQTKRG